jgi:hypothetical protein
MSRRSLISTLAAAVVIGACYLVWLENRQSTSELPTPYPRCSREVFPEADLDVIEVGASEWSLYREMKARPSQLFLFESGNGRACVRFRYDARLLPGPDVSLVVALDRRRIVNRWLVSDERMPPECAALPVENIEMTGLFDEGECYASLWDPPELRLPAIRGDPAWMPSYRKRHRQRAPSSN